MVYKYTFGNPFETESVIDEHDEINRINCQLQNQNLAFGNVSINQNLLQNCNSSIPSLGLSDFAFKYNYRLGDDDLIFGLGETTRGINKRGFLYKSWCSDDPSHTEDKTSLYGAHNFLIVYTPAGKTNPNPKAFALFFDYPGLLQIDCGYTSKNDLTVSAPSADINIYIIEENHSFVLNAICKTFRKMIGKSYLPPFWAFGYQQSRWSYYTADEVRNVLKNYQKAGIPLDAIYLDIDYMQGYRDFTIDEKKFPNFAYFVQELKDQGVHPVPIIDAGVKADPEYSVDREGIEKGYFCKKEDGSVFTAGVWPGKSHFPDFLNDEARAWFGDYYNFLTKKGIDGFWNDMNEPALFYSEDGIKKVFAELKESLDDTNLDINSFFGLRDKVARLANNPKDYASFYHTVKNAAGETQKISHDKVHNMYGYMMTRSAAEALQRNLPDKEILLFSRASMIGMHRYSGIWTGDNCAWWEHLRLSLRQMPGLNMCGFLYCGSDIGGFGCNTSRELLLRWLAFAMWTPLMRNHTAAGTRAQECYAFEQVEDFRQIISLRYRLIPHIYSEFVYARQENELLFKPLCFEYPDDKIALQTEDQLMFGRSIMIAPVVEPNARGRFVYLPEAMQMVFFSSSACGLESGLPQITEMEKGVHFVECEPNQVFFFIKKGHSVPLAMPAPCTAKLNCNDLTYIGK